METIIHFNGVKIVLTTAQTMREVQNYVDTGDVFISVYPLAEGGTNVLAIRERP